MAEMLPSPTRTSFDENVIDLYKRGVEIVESRLQGSDAVILGASCLVGDAVQMSRDNSPNGFEALSRSAAIKGVSLYCL